MKRHKTQIKRWFIAILIIACIAFACIFFFKFNIVTTSIISFTEGIIFLCIGERLMRQIKGGVMPYSYLTCGLASIVVISGSFYLMGRGAFITQENYSYWLLNLKKYKLKCIEFEVATLMLAYYIVFLILYGKAMWQIARKNIYQWVPSFWSLILGIAIMLYAREGFDHIVRTLTLVMCGGLLGGYLIIKYFIGREIKVVYRIQAKRYIGMFLASLMIIGVIGMGIPECQELPGTRLIRQISSLFSGETNLQDKIPSQTRLDNDVALSEAVLFEINASEPIYLRSIAYSEYENGIWKIPKQASETKSYMEFQPQYLEDEYKQTDSLLDEIAYQNSQNKNILPQYAKIANYEGNVTHKKQYTMVQNPINEINYFTVNGVTNIRNEELSDIYYYGNINNCYFHGKKLVEPSRYTVEYYDRVPKVGSREYLFLKSINAETCENIYNQLVDNRAKYGYYYEDMPKLLSTYNPMIQYKSAKKNFLQLPSELKEPLEHLTKSIIVSTDSDWSNAQAICDYLKHHYTYKINGKKQEGDIIYNFLFENQEGVCQEFASSMVLMCRSIGLPAKYVTGYLVTEKNEDTGRYIVREKDAHAFVEVYIAGYGWMSFDPTPSAEAEEVKESKQPEVIISDFIHFGSIGVIIIVILILSKGNMGFIHEKWWQITFRFYKPNKQIEKLMIRSCMWLDKMQMGREAYETLSQYGERIKKDEIDIMWIIRQYESYKYGGKNIDKHQIKIAYAHYKLLKEKLKNK